MIDTATLATVHTQRGRDVVVERQAATSVRCRRDAFSERENSEARREPRRLGGTVAQLAAAVSSSMPVAHKLPATSSPHRRCIST